MILQDVWKTQLTFSTHKPIVIEPVAEHLTSDAGMLLFGELDQQLDFTREFAAQLDDPRQDPDHPFLQMSRSAVSHDILSFSARVLNTTASVGALTSFEG